MFRQNSRLITYFITKIGWYASNSSMDTTNLHVNIHGIVLHMEKMDPNTSHASKQVQLFYFLNNTAKGKKRTDNQINT